MTTAEQLALVRQAIADVIAHGESYTLPTGQSVKHAPLSELRKTETELAATLRLEQLSGSSDGSMVGRVEVGLSDGR